MSTIGRAPVEGIGNGVFESRLIWAASPDDPTLAVRLFRQPETPDQMGLDARDVGLAMYTGHIHGAIAYIDRNGRNRATVGRGLLDAHALFRGVHRPYIKDGLDQSVYIYVSAHSSTFVCPDDRSDLRRIIKQTESPELSVFTTFVLFDDGSIRRWDKEIRLAGSDPEKVDGLIVEWEWTLADPTDLTLPDDFLGRYNERKW